jgi:hypothetical protein
VNPEARTPPDTAVLAAYLARRRIARRFYGWALAGFFGLSLFYAFTGIHSGVPRAVVALGLFILALAMACEWFLHRSRCPRCGQRFAGNSFILQSVALLTDKYRACQSCGLSEQQLSGEEVILDSSHPQDR